MNLSTRIVVVDDELPQLDALCTLLELEGFTVKGYGHPQEALRAIQTEGCDLLLTDLRLPDMAGTQLIAQAKQFDPDLGAILMTGYGSIKTAVEAMKLGALDYVLKPFKLADIMPVIERALENRALKRQNAQLLDSVTQANQQLMELNADLDTFAARVAHDLNSVMHLIQGHATNLTSRSSASFDEQEWRHIQRIRETSTRGGQLVSDLLAFSRLGNAQIDFKTVNLREVVGRAKILTELDSDGPRANWYIVNLPNVQGDESLLEQVFVNLFSNALKFSAKKSHPHIEVDLTETNEDYIISVKDNGVGFDPNLAKNLFKPFQRLHSSHDFHGHGMGLANVKKIIERHQGQISANSIPGDGAVFQIRLPKVIEANSPQNKLHRAAIEFQRQPSGTSSLPSDELSDHQQALEALKFSMALQRIGGQIGKMGSWAIDLQANNAVYWSEETFRVLDLEADGTPNLQKGIELYIGESQEKIAQAIAECSTHGTAFDIAAEMQTFKGRRIWTRVIGEAVPGTDGKPVRIQGCIQDITEKHKTEEMLHRINNLLIAQNHVTIAIGSLESPQAMFDEICRVAPTVGEVPLVWVVQFDRETSQLKVVAQGGKHLDLMPEIINNLGVKRDGELMAHLRKGELYICNDIRHEPFAARWQKEAIARGLESFVIIPLHVNGKLFAGLVNFGYGPGYFSTEMVALMQAIAKSRSLALENLVNGLEKSQTMESLKVLQTCVERLNDMVVITEAKHVDGDGPKILYVNDAFVRHTGYSPEDVIGRPPRIFNGENTQRDVIERIGAALKNWQPIREELIIYTKSQEQIWIEQEIVPIADGKGNYSHWVAIQRNITERKRSEKALEDSLQKFRSLTKVTSDCIWDWDLTTDELWWDEGIESMFGFSLHSLEPTSKSWTSRIHPEDLERVEKSIYSVIESESNTWQDEYRFAHVNSGWLDVIDRGYVIRNEEGKPVRMLGGMTDMSHIIQAKRQSQSQLEQMRLLHQITRAIGNRQDLNSIYQVVVNHLEQQLPADFCLMATYDAASDTLLPRAVGNHSKALARKLGIDVGAVVPARGVHIEQAVKGHNVHNANMATKRGPIGAAMHEVGGLHSLIITPLMNGNDTLGITVVARTAVDAFTDDEISFLQQLSEHVTLALNQAELLTELQEAYSDLKETQNLVLQQERLRALAEMASGIAHDINNAISPAALYAESLLATEHDMTERGKKNLRIIQTAIDDVAKTVDRMGRFARAKDDPDHQQLTDVNQVCKDVMDLTRVRWEDMAHKQGIQVHMRPELGHDLPQLMMSETELREILTNLIFNAIDALPEGGDIAIRTQIQGYNNNQQIVIEVCDNGIGMSEEHRARCFEPFFTTKGERGTGLGLAMVYGIVQRAGGYMEIHSVLNEGTQIQIYLPATACVTACETPNTTTTSQPPVSGKPVPLKILLVDDDTHVLSAMTEILNAHGHQIEFADGGKKAIELFNEAAQDKHPFDVMITDLGMPGMDGRELSQIIKTLSPSTPVIMLTGWGSQMSLSDEEMPHVNLILSKPPKASELQQALGNIQKK